MPRLLHSAAQHGNMKEVTRLLANGADVNEDGGVSGGVLQRGFVWYVFEHGPGPGLWSCECLGYAGQEIACRFEPEGWLVQCKVVSGGGLSPNLHATATM